MLNDVMSFPAARPGTRVWIEVADQSRSTDAMQS